MCKINLLLSFLAGKAEWQSFATLATGSAETLGYTGYTSTCETLQVFSSLSVAYFFQVFVAGAFGATAAARSRTQR